MPAVNPQVSPQAPGELSKLTLAFREFKGAYTKSARNAMPQNYFYNVENAIPIGAANLQTVENIGSLIHDFSTDTIYESVYIQVGSVPYQISFSTTGKVFAYNWNTQATTTLATGLSGAGSRAVGFYNLYVLVVDSTGYYSWDGSSWTKASGTDFPSAGTDIAVYDGRVWIGNGRLITVSCEYLATTTTDPTQNTAWQAANGATFVVMTDQAMVGNIVRLMPQNGVLYVFGTTCVFAISDLFVNYGAIPPTPQMLITLVQGIIGTDQPLSIFPYNRLLMFANRFGAWAISGVDAQRVSEEIDGTWQYLSFNPSISGGQCVTRNILCAAFLLKRSNDPVFGSNTVLGMWFDGTWFFANFGTITLLASAIIGGKPALLAFIGNKMYQIFADDTSSPDVQLMTPLWGLDDPLSIKNVVRVGVELTTKAPGGTVSLTLDSVNGSQPVPLTGQVGTLEFLGLNGQPLTFSGTGSITWTVGSYQLYDAAGPGGWSQYVGMTVEASGIEFQLSSFFMDYKLGRRWAGQ